MVEVILLAGTAFAVAARRRVRDVALVLANGGRPADVRRTLLAQGVVLGLLGAAVGVAVGVGALAASMPGLQRLADMDFAGIIVRPGDLAVIAAVGVLSGVAAAVVPAWSASRVPVVTALAGRYGRPTRAARRAGTVAAVAAAVAGFALAGLMSARWGDARTAQAAETEPTTPGPGLAYPMAMVAGFAVAMLGLTVLAPSLVGLAGRLAARLPLTGRLAVRDAARHRHRTGPAVGAVMVAVAGSVAVAFAVASNDRHDRDRYEPRLPTGWVTVWSFSGSPGANLAAGRTAAAELPATRVGRCRCSHRRPG